jgi:hypothetical protein
MGAGTTAVYQSVGAMGIRNSAYKLVYSAWTMGDNWLYSNDYSLTTGNWSGLVKVVDSTATPPLWSTMATYKYDVINPSGHTGFLYGTAPAPDILKYGQYGIAPVTPSTVPASVAMMAWIVVLVFGALIVLIILAYGTSEAIKGGGTEFVKVGIIGLITLIIAATIVAAML